MERSGVDVRGGFSSVSGAASSAAPPPPSSLAESSSLLFNAAVGSSRPPARRCLLSCTPILKGRRPYYARLTLAAAPDSNTCLELRTGREVCDFASSARCTSWEDCPRPNRSGSQPIVMSQGGRWKLFQVL